MPEANTLPETPEDKLAELQNDRYELRKRRDKLSDRIRELVGQYVPSEDHEDGLPIPGDTWDKYLMLSQHLKIESDRSEIVDREIRAMGRDVAAEIMGSGSAKKKELRELFQAYVEKSDQAEQYIKPVPGTSDYAGLPSFDLQAAMTRTGAGSDTSGASAIEELTARNVLVESMVAFGGIADLATIYMTETGQNVRMPNVDATSQMGVRLAEATEASDLDLPDLGHTTLRDHIYASRVAVLSLQQIRDASFDIVSWARRSLMTRVGRIIDVETTTGDGTESRPQGFMSAVGSALTTATTGTFTWPELLRLYGEVDDGYLMDVGSVGVGVGGKIAYAMNKKTLVLLMGLADAENKPLFMPDINNMGTMQLFGFPIQKVYQMPDVAANAIPIAFGNFSYYVLRLVDQNLILRFDDSAYAKRGAAGFLSFAEADGKWVQQLNSGNVSCVKGLTIKGA